MLYTWNKLYIRTKHNCIKLVLLWLCVNVYFFHLLLRTVQVLISTRETGKSKNQIKFVDTA